MRVRMVSLVALVLLLTVFGMAAAQADCVALCPPPAQPDPEPQPGPKPGPQPQPDPQPQPQPQPKGEKAVPAGAQRLLDLINRTRAEHGLAPMAARGDVASIAVDHSFAQARAGDIWHNDAYFTAATKQRLNAKTVGENVALNASIDDAHARLMRSPGHRANIVNPVFTVVGIGVVQKDGGTYYITQNFVEPRAAAPAAASRKAAPAPAPKAAPKPAAAAPAPAPAPVPTTDAPATTTTYRDHVPNGVANATTTTEGPRALQAGAAPTDLRSASLLLALLALGAAGAAAGRHLVRTRTAASAG